MTSAGFNNLDESRAQAISVACRIIRNSVVRLIGAMYGEDREQAHEIADQITLATGEMSAELEGAGLLPSAVVDEANTGLDFVPSHLLSSDHNRNLLEILERAYEAAGRVDEERGHPSNSVMYSLLFMLNRVEREVKSGSAVPVDRTESS